jgi:hypothetical protein
VRKGTFLAALVACAAALLAAGCGGGGGTETVTASSIGKAEYIKQASKVCEETAKRMKADFALYTQEHSGKENQNPAGVIEDVFAPNVEQEIGELRELGAPKSDVKTVEALLKAREEALLAVEKEPKSATTNAPFQKSIKAAKDYGIVACAVP